MAEISGIDYRWNLPADDYIIEVYKGVGLEPGVPWHPINYMAKLTGAMRFAKNQQFNGKTCRVVNRDGLVLANYAKL